MQNVSHHDSPVYALKKPLLGQEANAAVPPSVSLEFDAKNDVTWCRHIYMIIHSMFTSSLTTDIFNLLCLVYLPEYGFCVFSHSNIADFFSRRFSRFL